MFYKIRVVFLVLLFVLLIFMIYPTKYQIVNSELQLVDESGVKIVPKSVGVFVVNLNRSPDRLAYVNHR